MNRRAGLVAIFTLTAGVLAGCARPGYDTVEMKYANLPAGQGRIYVYQPSSPGDPTTGSPYVLVNGWKTGRTTPGDFFFVDRPAGRYAVTIQYNDSVPLKFDLTPGQTRYVRVNKGGSRLTFNEETKDKAEAEMASMSYHGASSRERRAIKRAYPAPQGYQAPETYQAPAAAPPSQAAPAPQTYPVAR
jgi:hypothetical protein